MVQLHHHYQAHEFTLCKTCESSERMHFDTLCQLFFFFNVYQATVLEEMPPFPERESSLLAKLKKKKPTAGGGTEEKKKGGIELNSIGESSTDSLEVRMYQNKEQVERKNRT